MGWLLLCAAIAGVYFLLGKSPSSSAAKFRPPSRERSYSSKTGAPRGSRASPVHGSRQSQIRDNEQILREAMVQGKRLTITYIDREGERTVRSVKPIKIFDYDYGEGLMRCVRAHCYLRNAERTFALFRIKQIN